MLPCSCVSVVLLMLLALFLCVSGAVDVALFLCVSGAVDVACLVPVCQWCCWFCTVSAGAGLADRL